MVVKFKFPNARHIVGIASESAKIRTGSSEDLVYLDASYWSKELNAEAEKLQNELGILNSLKESYSQEKDFPD